MYLRAALSDPTWKGINVSSSVQAESYTGWFLDQQFGANLGSDHQAPKGSIMVVIFSQILGWPPAAVSSNPTANESTFVNINEVVPNKKYLLTML